MKKKLLFFGYTLDMGGAEKVLIDFLKVLKSNYEIDLVLLQAKGVLMKELPEGIRVKQIRKGLLSYILFRFVPFFRKRKINKIANAKDYDVAIGFFEGRSATWVADIKKDIRRIAWVHTDVNFFDIGIPEKEILSSYSKMDAVVFVSEDARNNFIKKYGICSDSAKVLYNLIDQEKIIEMAKEPVEPNDCFTFINVGRMNPAKRQDRLVEIAKLLKAEGFEFKIQILGDGDEAEKIKRFIKEADVCDVVELLGMKTNPYPYVKQADCFVLTSDFEGFGIAVKEALLLRTPIISTAVSGVKELLKNGEYGILCEIDTEQIYSAMRSVLVDEKVLEKICGKIEEFDCSNKDIVDKLIYIIEKD